MSESTGEPEHGSASAIPVSDEFSRTRTRMLDTNTKPSLRTAHAPLGPLSGIYTDTETGRFARALDDYDIPDFRLPVEELDASIRECQLRVNRSMGYSGLSPTTLAERQMVSPGDIQRGRRSDVGF